MLKSTYICRICAINTYEPYFELMLLPLDYLFTFEWEDF